MATWHELTRDPEYQSLSANSKAVVKKGFFDRQIVADPEFQKFSKETQDAIANEFWSTPDDSGQGIITSTIGGAVRGFGEIVPGAIQGAGALTGIDALESAGKYVREGLEYVAPVNPLYQDSIPVKAAGVVGNIGSVLATAGVGGAIGKGLAAERIAAGASAADQALAASQAISRGANTALYGSAGLQGAASGAQTADQYGLTGLDRYGNIIAGGLIEAGTELLPFGLGAETAAAKRLLGAAPRAGRFAGDVFSEAGEEFTGQVANNAALAALAPAGTETPGLLDGAVEAGLYGGLGGGILGGVNLATGAYKSPSTVAATDLNEAAKVTAPEDTAQTTAAVDATIAQMNAAMQRGAPSAPETPSDVEERLAAIQSGPSAFYQQLQRGITPQATFVGQETPSDVESRLAAIQHEPIATAPVGGLIPETPSATVANLEGGSGDDTILGIGDDGRTVLEEARVEAPRPPSPQGLVSTPALAPTIQESLTVEAPRITELARQAAAIASGAEKGSKPIKLGNPPLTLPWTGINSESVAKEYGLPSDFYEMQSFSTPANPAGKRLEINQKYQTDELKSAISELEKWTGSQSINAATGKRMGRDRVNSELARIAAAARTAPSILEVGERPVQQASQNNLVTQKRAKAGGEFGPNGEWYSGGAFIATTDMPKKVRAKISKAASGREQVEAGYGADKKQEIPAGKLPIVARIMGTFIGPDGAVNEAFVERSGHSKETVDQVHEAAKRYRNGERLLDVTEFPLLANFSDAARLIDAGQPIPGDLLDKMPEDVRSILVKATNAKTPNEQQNDSQNTSKSGASTQSVTASAQSSNAGGATGNASNRQAARTDSRGGGRQSTSGTETSSQSNRDDGTPTKPRGKGVVSAVEPITPTTEKPTRIATEGQPMSGDSGSVVRDKTRLSRGKPRESIAFKKPVITPLGEVVGYSWSSQLVEDVDKAGEPILRRVSNWEEAANNAETGRDIVHRFLIRKPDGSASEVSLESTFGKMTAADKQTIKSVISAAKRLPFMRAELAELQDLQKRSDEDYQRTQKLVPDPAKFELREPDVEWRKKTGDKVAYLDGVFLEYVRGSDLNTKGELPSKAKFIYDNAWKWQGAQRKVEITPAQSDRLKSITRSVKKAEELLKKENVEVAKVTADEQPSSLAETGPPVSDTKTTSVTTDQPAPISYEPANTKRGRQGSVDVGIPSGSAETVSPSGSTIERPSLGVTGKQILGAWRSIQGVQVAPRETVVGRDVNGGGTYAFINDRLVKLRRNDRGFETTYTEATDGDWQDVSDALDRGAFQVELRKITGLGGYQKSDSGKTVKVLHQATGRLLQEFLDTQEGAAWQSRMDKLVAEKAPTETPSESLSTRLNAAKSREEAREILNGVKNLLALKDLAKEMGYPTTGTKKDVVNRLVAAVGSRFDAAAIRDSGKVEEKAKAEEKSPEKQAPSEKVEAGNAALDEMLSELSPAIQAKWTPEMRAKADKYFETGNYSDLDGLTTVQKTKINEARLKSNKEAEAAQKAADKLYEKKLREEEKENARLEKERAEQEKLTESRRESLDSIIGTPQGVEMNAVSAEDGQESLALVHNSGDVPGVLNAFVGTSKGFLANPENEANYPELWKILKGGRVDEGNFAYGRAFVFTDGIGVNESDRRNAAKLGITPALAAVRRVLIHESLVHRGIYGLPARLQMQILQWVKQNAKPEDLDALAKTYPQYADWATNPQQMLGLAEEFLAKNVEKMTRFPTSGPLARLVEILKEIWRYVTGKDGEPTVQNLRDIVKLLKAGAKAADARLVNGGGIKMSSTGLRLKQTRAALIKATEDSSDWKDWYQRHEDTLTEFFGSDSDLFQKILSVTSQAASVKANVGLALKAYVQLKTGAPFEGFLPAVIKNLDRVKNDTQVGGQKIAAYQQANTGADDVVVVDRHISRMLFGVDSPSAKQFKKGQQVLTEIAQKLGWQPRQVQAAMWAASIRKAGNTPESYDSYLRTLNERGTLNERIGEVVPTSARNQAERGIGGLDFGRGAESSQSGLGSPEIKASRISYANPLDAQLASASERMRQMREKQGAQEVEPSPSGLSEVAVVIPTAFRGQTTPFDAKVPKGGLHFSSDEDYARSYMLDGFSNIVGEESSITSGSLSFRNPLDLRGVKTKAQAEASFAKAGIPLSTKVRLYPFTQNEEYKGEKTLREWFKFLDSAIDGFGPDFSPNEALTDHLGEAISPFVDGIIFDEHGNPKTTSYVIFNSSQFSTRNPESSRAAGGTSPQQIRNEIRKAYDAAIIGQGSVQAPLQQVYDLAKAAIPTLTERQFGEQVQALYEDGSAFLVPTDRSADMLAAGEKWGVYDVAGLPASYIGVMPSQETTKVYATGSIFQGGRGRIYSTLGAEGDGAGVASIPAGDNSERAQTLRRVVDEELWANSTPMQRKEAMDAFGRELYRRYSAALFANAVESISTREAVRPGENPSATIYGEGDREALLIDVNTTINPKHEILSQSSLEAFAFMYDAMQEEMIHVAQHIATWREWIASGSRQRLDVFQHNKYVSMLNDVVMQRSDPKAKVKIDTALLTSWNMYHPDNRKTSIEEVFAELQKSRLDIPTYMMELGRQLVQIGRQDFTTETGWTRFKETLIKWANEIRDALRSVLADVKGGTFGNLLKNEIDAIEGVISHLESGGGVMPTEIKASRVSSDTEAQHRKLIQEKKVVGPQVNYGGRPMQDEKGNILDPTFQTEEGYARHNSVAQKIVADLIEQLPSPTDLPTELNSDSYLNAIGAERNIDLQQSLFVEAEYALRKLAEQSKDPEEAHKLIRSSKEAQAYARQLRSGAGRALGRTGWQYKDSRYSGQFVVDGIESAKAEEQAEAVDGKFTEDADQQVSSINSDANQEANDAMAGDLEGALENEQLEEGKKSLSEKARGLLARIQSWIADLGAVRMALASKKGNIKASSAAERRSKYDNMTVAQLEAEESTLSKKVEDALEELADELFKTAQTKKSGKKVTKAGAKKTAEKLARPTAKEKLLKGGKMTQLQRLLDKTREGWTWAQIFTLPEAGQFRRRADMLQKVKENEAFADLTDDEKSQLVDLLDQAWYDRKAEYFGRLMQRMGAKLPFASNKSASLAVVQSVDKLLKHFNDGTFDRDAFREVLAEKFGIKPINQENLARAKQLAQEMQSPDISNPMWVKKADELIKLVSEGQKLSKARILSDWWITSVLSGPRTLFAIATAFSNGLGRIIADGGSNVILKGDVKSMGQALKRYFELWPQAFKEMGHYIVSGDKSILENSKEQLSGFMADGLKGGSPISTAYQLLNWNKDKRPDASPWEKTQGKIMRMMGRFMTVVERILTGLDHFNAATTKYGYLPLAIAQNRAIYESARLPTEAEMNNYRNQAKAELFDGKEPQTAAEKIVLDNWARQLSDKHYSEFQDIVDGANYAGQIAAMTTNPEGFAGGAYRLILGAASKGRDAADKIARQAELIKKDPEASKYDIWLAQTSAAAAQLAAYSAQNLLGLRFIRYLSNKFSDTLTYIPIAGALLRAGEKTNRNNTKKSIIQSNQAIGFTLGWLGWMAVKAIADEPDDEKRGWSINGSWESLSPEQKSQLMSDGGKAYSITIYGKDGKKHVLSYQGWPISAILSAIGTLTDMVKYQRDKWDEKDYGDRLFAAAYVASTSVADTAALSQLSEIMGKSVHSSDPIESGVKRFSRYGSNFAGGFIPRIFKDMDSWFNEGINKYDGVYENFAKEVPWYRTAIGKPRLDIFGEQVKVSRMPWSREFPRQPTDPAYKILGKLNQRDLWLSPSDPALRTVGTGKRRRHLNPEEQDRYMREVSQGYKGIVEKYGQRILAMPGQRAEDFLADKAKEVRDRAEKKAIRRLTPSSS